jgi:hypothetical protein
LGGNNENIDVNYVVCLSAIPASPSPRRLARSCKVGAAASLIGLGLPAALAVGGVLLGAKLFKRWRNSQSLNCR